MSHRPELFADVKGRHPVDKVGAISSLDQLIYYVSPYQHRALLGRRPTKMAVSTWFPEAAYQTSLNTLNSILAPAAPSTGCGSALAFNVTPGAPSININIHSPLSSPNETLQERRYRIHIPQSYPTTNNEVRPLVLAFNGQYQNTSSIERYTKFSENNDAIVVYPEGILDQWLGDVAAPNSSYINDVQFVNDVLDDVEAKFCVDTNRVYAAGFSNGGGLTGLLACNETVGSRFAAFAGVAASYYLDEQLTEPLFGKGCGLGRAEGRITPYLEVHGEEDAVVPYDGNNTWFTPPAFLDQLAQLNGCGSGVGSSEYGLANLESNFSQVLDGGNVTKYSWTCENHADLLVHYRVASLGHGWPSTVTFGGILDEFRGGPGNWNATNVITEWFSRWSLQSSWSVAGAQVQVNKREASGESRPDFDDDNEGLLYSGQKCGL